MSKPRGGAARAAWTCVGLVIAACAGPTASPDAGTPLDASARDAGAGSDTIALRVIRYDDAGTAVPLAGAAVALDDASGARVELTTGADGLATFTGTSWARGPFDYVVWLSGHTAIGFVGLTQALYDARVRGGVIDVAVPDPTPTATVTVTGAITGLSGSGHTVLVQSTSNGGSWQDRGASYTLPTRRDAPFRLVSTEFSVTFDPDGRGFAQPFSAWTISPEQPAPSADVSLDVDLSANRVASHVVSGSYPIPHGAAGSLFATAMPYAFVTDAHAQGNFGFPNRMTLSADASSVDYTIEWIDAPGAPAPTTVYGMSSSSEASYAIEPGAPAAGARTFELLVPPQVAPPAGAFPHLHDTVVLTAAPPAGVISYVYVSSDDVISYVVVAPAGNGTRIPVPTLPSAAPSTVLGGTLGRVVRLCDPVGEGAALYCARSATGGGSALDP